MPTARERGLQALEASNQAFARLPGEELDAVAVRALAEARGVLNATAVVMLNHVGVTRTQTVRPNLSAPSLTATLSSTPS